ncbi:MAG: GTP 3',8-cyclase MoaA [Synergistales bacterium]|nr:GTP 3',8-cyclase MoaA [Synergistales bacterium]
MAELIDTHGRQLNYMRVSVTDRCNFRCRYCMPEEGIPWIAHDEILSYEELLSLFSIFWEMGIRKIRLTGGEPLVRKGLFSFIKTLHDCLPRMKVVLTTNGSLIEPHIREIRQSSLAGINVSMDTLDPERFHHMTRIGRLENVRRGIDALAHHADIPLKLNTVLIRGFNDGEVEDLIDFASEHRAVLRLIEFMPLDESVWNRERFISSDEIFTRLPQQDQWKRLPGKDKTAGPAVYYQNSRTGQRLGIIAAVSHHFCATCNRLRLTATGELRTCLFSETGAPLRELLRKGDHQAVRRRIESAVKEKPIDWRESAGERNNSHMSRIGG